MMKRLLLTLIFTTALWIGLRAQSSSLVLLNDDPDTIVYEISGEVYDSKDISVYAVNIGQEQLKVLWKVVDVSVPDEWGFVVCDNNLCYSEGVNVCPEDAPNVLNHNDTLKVKMTTLNKGVSATGVYDFIVFDKSNPSISDTVRLVIIAKKTVRTTGVLRTSSVGVFPNPATDYFYLKGNAQSVHTVELLNIVGERLRLYRADQNAFYIGDLDNGVYFVRLRDASGKLLRVLRLRKK